MLIHPNYFVKNKTLVNNPKQLKMSIYFYHVVRHKAVVNNLNNYIQTATLTVLLGTKQW